MADESKTKGHQPQTSVRPTVRVGKVTVNKNEVASIDDSDEGDVALKLGPDWWTDERHIRVGQHERNKNGDLLTIEARVIHRGVCKTDDELTELNAQTVSELEDLFVQLTLMYYDSLKP